MAYQYVRVGQTQEVRIKGIKPKKILESVIPKVYRSFTKLFIEPIDNNTLLEHQPQDYKILLKEGIKLKLGLIYPLL